MYTLHSLFALRVGAAAHAGRVTISQMALGCLLIGLMVPATAHAWEAATTHPGITERAALSSQLHQQLRQQFGLERGVYAPLTVPPADAESLFRILAAYNPVHGYVPDARGRLAAIGWLAAGAAVANIPAPHAAHHFFDPMTGSGLRGESVSGVPARLRHALYRRTAGVALPSTGIAAPDWALSEDNPMGLPGFIAQYQKAVRARTPGERERHLAGALLAAGSVLHVLQDMGSPSHVRGDYSAHFERLGPGEYDWGVRFERVAALGYGRLGIPKPARAVTFPSLRAFFTNSDGTGLADLTAAQWFSANTLPAPLRIHTGMSRSDMATALEAALRRPEPAPQARRLDLDSAERTSARLDSDAGTCLANYRITEAGSLRWYMDDDCIAEQVAAILPEVSAYSVGALEWLFRGSIVPRANDNDKGAIALTCGDTALGPGRVELFWDDELGVRNAIGAGAEVSGAEAGGIIASLASADVPEGARAIAVLYQGTDGNGEPISAAGYLRL